MPPSPDAHPVSDILRTAARLGMDVQPDWLPDSAFALYEAIHDGLAPRLHLSQADRRRIALDTTAVLCAEQSGVRIAPSTAYGVAAEIVARCLSAHGLDDGCVPHVINEISIACRGGIKLPALREVENRLRNERMRQEHYGGETYATIARRYRLSVSQVRNILGEADLGGT